MVIELEYYGSLKTVFPRRRVPSAFSNWEDARSGPDAMGTLRPLKELKARYVCRAMSFFSCRAEKSSASMEMMREIARQDQAAEKTLRTKRLGTGLSAVIALSPKFNKLDSSERTCTDSPPGQVASMSSSELGVTSYKGEALADCASAKARCKQDFWRVVCCRTCSAT